MSGLRATHLMIALTKRLGTLGASGNRAIMLARDTIHALASGAPPVGVAVIRVSGPRVRGLIEEWIGRPLQPRRASLVTLRGEDGAPLDEALAIHFPTPRSFTGEDVLELHCHGGAAVLRAVMERLVALGSRPAEPGEFTMRAHASGRIDLIEAERLADLIDAQTAEQLRFAASDRGRRLSELYGRWGDALLHARALIEASLDFADEEDAPLEVGEEVVDALEDLQSELQAHLATRRHREIVRSGLRVAIAGPPNAGKSSLLNALAGREAAIVTPVPGTTRDVVEVAIEVEGHRIVLWDTAGLRDTLDPVERIGIERARTRIGEADVVVWLDPVDAGGSDGNATEHDGARPTIRVRSKIDMANTDESSAGQSAPTPAPGGSHDVVLSTATGAGLPELLSRLAATARAFAPPPGTETTMNERHEQHLETVLCCLGKAVGPPERVAEELRLAAQALGRITGASSIEDVYGAIFSRFCMGK